MSDFSGNWHVVGYDHLNGELSLFDGEPRAEDLRSWLVGSNETKPAVTAAGGMKIEIHETAFCESVTEFSRLMFDIEGVQVNDYQPMAGRLHIVEQVGFLLPDEVPEYASPSIDSGVACRYSDGDTIVCDTLRCAGDVLIRQVSVITDELYLDRIVLAYRPDA
ncbi:MAG: hypothetical protein AAFX06_29300 [Planctomycetota bacterium]